MATCTTEAVVPVRMHTELFAQKRMASPAEIQAGWRVDQGTLGEPPSIRLLGVEGEEGDHRDFSAPKPLVDTAAGPQAFILQAHIKTTHFNTSTVVLHFVLWPEPFADPPREFACSFGSSKQYF